jgi:NhaA family Na+:H+ antiporter
MLLSVGAVIGFVWANASFDAYERFAGALRFAVNDVGMMFFFALAAKEVTEATAPDGDLSSIRRAGMPVLAGCGGMIVPAALFILIARAAGAAPLAHGWAIPCATDIAFSYLIAGLLLGPGHPGIPFLLLLAIADDAMGLVILAAFYPTGPVRLIEFVALLAVAMAIAYGLRRGQVTSFWPYLAVAGGLSWVAFWRGGFHPALALVPIVPFLPHAARDPGLFVHAPEGAHDTLSQLEHFWSTPVEYVLLAFGLVNAGVPIGSIGIGTWAVLAAILVGKPAGIVSFSLAGRLAGLHLPPGLHVRELIVVGCVAAIGFTVALFFATASFPDGPYLAQTKMGALLSIGGAVVATAVAAVLRAGRFGS